MKSLSSKLFIIGLLNLAIFVGIFSLFQNEYIYHKTLGKFSSNYIRVKVNGETEIHNAKVPFIKLADNKFENWDADIYRCIKNNAYKKDGSCYTEVKGAFFPLFPLIWKISHLNNIGISLFNYLLFVCSLLLLVQQFLKATNKDKLIVYTILLTLPSVIIYYIPYTEALFFFTMLLAFIGHNRNKYWLYFISMMAMAMLRPASLFIVLAILAIDFLCLLSHKKIFLFLNESIKKTVPFFLGYIVAILIQYSSTSSFSTMLEAQNYWHGSIGIFNQITDWSLEGFGLNVFAICFIALPALVFSIYSVLGKNKFKNMYNESILKSKNAMQYFLLISVFYLSGILVFVSLTGNGNFHSFFRFTMCSPPFFIAIICLLNYLNKNNIGLSSLLFSIPLTFLLAFLLATEYGGNNLDFPFAGMYISILSFGFLLFRQFFSFKIQWALASFLILASLVWTGYLLNIFMNEGWIFT